METNKKSRLLIGLLVTILAIGLVGVGGVFTQNSVIAAETGHDFSSYTSPSGCDIYVSASGNDSSGDGSEGSPYKTVQKGINTSSSGEKVCVEGGNYGGFNINTPNLTVAALNAPDSTDAALIEGRIRVESDGTTLKGFLIDPSSLDASGNEVEGIFVGDGSGFTNTSGGITIASNIIKEFSLSNSEKTAEAIHVKHFNSGDQINRLVIENNWCKGVHQSAAGANAIKLQANLNNVEVKANTIEGITGSWSYGIAITYSSGEDSYPKNVTINGNLLDIPSPTDGAVGLDDSDPSEVMIASNDFIGDGRDLGNYNANQDEHPNGKLVADNNYFGDNGPETSSDTDLSIDYSPWLGKPVGTTPQIYFTNDNIQDAIDKANTNDKVKVKPGMYKESVTVNKENLTLMSIKGSNNTLINADGNDFAILVDGKHLGNLTIKGFKVKGWKVGGIGQGMSSRTGTKVHIINNEVEVHKEGPSEHGNSIQTTGDGSVIKGNRVEVTGYDHEESDWGTSGILGMGNDIVIKNNIVEYVDNGTSELHQGIAVGGGWHVPANNIDVINNTVKGSETGIAVEGSASEATVDHNTIKNTHKGIAARTIGDGSGNLPTGTKAHFNNFIDNDIGIINQGQDLIDATDNYWGADNGPSGGVNDPLTGAVANGDGDEVSENVRFDPWLTQGSSQHSYSSGWNLMSIPVDPSDTSTDAIFNEPGISHGGIYDYTPGSGYFRPSERAQGSANWIKVTSSSATVEVEGSSADVTTVTCDNGAGWYLIGMAGSPKWGNIELLHDQDGDGNNETHYVNSDDSNGDWIKNTFYGYDNASDSYVGSADPDARLNPWMGYWVKTKVDNVTFEYNPGDSSHPLSLAFGSTQAPKLTPLSSEEVEELGIPKPPKVGDSASVSLEVNTTPNPVTASSGVTFSASSAMANVESISVEVFTSSGKPTYQAKASGSSLNWDLLSNDGKPVSNGLYLYTVKARVGGSTVRSGVNKLLVLK